jgi:hypothetical protein
VAIVGAAKKSARHKRGGTACNGPFFNRREEEEPVEYEKG